MRVKTNVAGITTMVTLIYFHHVILILFVFKICIHRRVARVPIGRISDPISLPMMFDKYTVFVKSGVSPISVKAKVDIIKAG